jgi:hypothetical protein
VSAEGLAATETKAVSSFFLVLELVFVDFWAKMIELGLAAGIEMP